MISKVSFLDFSNEITLQIIDNLDVNTLINLSYTCKSLHQICLVKLYSGVSIRYDILDQSQQPIAYKNRYRVIISDKQQLVKFVTNVISGKNDIHNLVKELNCHMSPYVLNFKDQSYNKGNINELNESKSRSKSSSSDDFFEKSQFKEKGFLKLKKIIRRLSLSANNGNGNEIGNANTNGNVNSYFGSNNGKAASHRRNSISNLNDNNKLFKRFLSSFTQLKEIYWKDLELMDLSYLKPDVLINLTGLSLNLNLISKSYDNDYSKIPLKLLGFPNLKNLVLSYVGLSYEDFSFIYNFVPLLVKTNNGFIKLNKLYLDIDGYILDFRFGDFYTCLIRPFILHNKSFNLSTLQLKIRGVKYDLGDNSSYSDDGDGYRQVDGIQIKTYQHPTINWSEYDKNIRIFLQKLDQFELQTERFYLRQYSGVGFENRIVALISNFNLPNLKILSIKASNYGNFNYDLILENMPNLEKLIFKIGKLTVLEIPQYDSKNWNDKIPLVRSNKLKEVHIDYYNMFSRLKHLVEFKINNSDYFNSLSRLEQKKFMAEMNETGLISDMNVPLVLRYQKLQCGNEDPKFVKLDGKLFSDKRNSINDLFDSEEFEMGEFDGVCNDYKTINPTSKIHLKNTNTDLYNGFLYDCNFLNEKNNEKIMKLFGDDLVKTYFRKNKNLKIFRLGWFKFVRDDTNDEYGFRLQTKYI